ncbi:MAG TPA: DUF1127 domain-containing protein [Variovorax sp.]|nr:DUF1127 domain-containing protein [Variovorax sp.]
MQLQHYADRLKSFLSSRASGAQRHQAAQLHAMSDHELADLGIGRSEIPALVVAQSINAPSSAWNGCGPA